VIPEIIFLHESDWAIWWDHTATPGQLLDPETTNRDICTAWDELSRLGSEYGFRVGMSGNSATSLQAAADAARPDVVFVAKQYDLIWRSAEQLIRWAKDVGISIWCGAPFHQGALFDLVGLAQEYRSDEGLREQINSLREIMKETGTTILDLAIPFLFADDRISAVATGVRSVSELRAAIRSVESQISSSLLHRLRLIGISRPARTGPAFQAKYLLP
jgi:aryl-alcohol dehydrogenase-like predicted oxidoreductase